MKGLEPPRREAQDPKSCAATNYATSAYMPHPQGEGYGGAKIIIFPIR